MTLFIVQRGFCRPIGGLLVGVPMSQGSLRVALGYVLPPLPGLVRGIIRRYE